jgi:hypothetical protein
MQILLLILGIGLLIILANWKFWSNNPDREDI